MMMIMPLSTKAYVSVIREEIHQGKISEVPGTDGLKMNLKTFNTNSCGHVKYTWRINPYHYNFMKSKYRCGFVHKNCDSSGHFEIFCLSTTCNPASDLLSQ